MVRLVVVTSLLSLFSTFSFANSLGERSGTEYSGPHLATVKNTTDSTKLVLEDDYHSEWYLNSKFQYEIFELNSFLKGEFLSAHLCPDEVYLKYKNYYQYLIRLLSLSYYHSSIREYESSAKIFGSTDICKPDWKTIFKSCSPKSTDMKNFLRNVDHVLDNIEQISVDYKLTTKEARSLWLEDFKKQKDRSLTQVRLRIYCEENNCDNISESNINSKLEKICKQDLTQVKNLCSEKDEYYGLSYAPQVYPLLVKSNALGSISPKKFQTGCLRRFILENQNRELVYRPIRSIYAHLYSKGLESENSLEQGKLFYVGALKEFEQKGLTNIFEKKDLGPKIVQKKPSKLIKKKEPKLEKIELPKIKNTPRKVRPKKVVKKKVKQKTYSSFKVASDFREKNELSSVDVDMFKFKYDYVFTISQNQDYEKFVEKFSTVASLKKMKSEDDLGGVKAPVPLKFLKFLIDKNMHQGLFNMTFILGDEFFVINDIDKTNEIEKIKLINNSTSNHSWLIRVISTTEP